MSDDPTRWEAFTRWADEDGADCPACGLDSVVTDDNKCRTCGLSAEPLGEMSTLDHLRDGLGRIDPERAALLLGLDDDEATPAALDAWADNLHDMTGEARFEQVAALLLFILEGWA